VREAGLMLGVYSSALVRSCSWGYEKQFFGEEGCWSRQRGDGLTLDVKERKDP